ncbi:MAG: ECF transporter S component [Candidatus Verstraetearchaeota archaeon]|nr:ECF transporter S component [Candidatus Verstraetearchaeota archaeon]
MERRELALAAVFTALVCVATMSIQVYIPATRGYFNVGEVMVYTAALLLGARLGAVAGGVGSALADLLTGYVVYAPATLVIKGCEGFIVGWLSRRLLKLSSRAGFPMSAVLGSFAGIAVWFMGTRFYVGEAELSIGSWTYIIFASEEVWIAMAVAVFAIVVLLGFLARLPSGVQALAVLVGGAVMVSGYFLYEAALFGVAVAAVEVPFNVFQALIGLLISLPLVNALKKALPEFP